jgi:Pyruvate/2-oxoacid:ferredoxin oxidoreductase gamma subunit
MLGCLCRLIAFMNVDSLAKAIGQRFSDQAADMNEKALRLGYQLAESRYSGAPLQYN